MVPDLTPGPFPAKEGEPAARRAPEQAKFYLQHAAGDFNGHRAAAQDLTGKAIQEVLAGLATDGK